MEGQGWLGLSAEQREARAWSRKGRGDVKIVDPPQ